MGKLPSGIPKSSSDLSLETLSMRRTAEDGAVVVPRWLQVLLGGHTHTPSGKDAKTAEDKSVSSSPLATRQRVPDRNHTLLPKAVTLLLSAEGRTARIPSVFLNHPPNPFPLPSAQEVFSRGSLCGPYLSKTYLAMLMNHIQ